MLEAGAFVDRLLTGHAAEVLVQCPAACVDLVITSPPYWTAVEYEQGANAWPSYERYLDDMQAVWSQCARVLRPNGKLCINAPVLPIPKAVIRQHTRHLKNIAFDMEQRILAETELDRYALFVWQKQTSSTPFRPDISAATSTIGASAKARPCIIRSPFRERCCPSAIRTLAKAIRKCAALRSNAR